MLSSVNANQMCGDTEFTKDTAESPEDLLGHGYHHTPSTTVPRFGTVVTKPCTMGNGSVRGSLGDLIPTYHTTVKGSLQLRFWKQLNGLV